MDARADYNVICKTTPDGNYEYYKECISKGGGFFYEFTPNITGAKLMESKSHAVEILARIINSSKARNHDPRTDYSLGVYSDEYIKAYNNFHSYNELSNTWCLELNI